MRFPREKAQSIDGKFSALIFNGHGNEGQQNVSPKTQSPFNQERQPETKFIINSKKKCYNQYHKAFLETLTCWSCM